MSPNEFQAMLARLHENDPRLATIVEQMTSAHEQHSKKLQLRIDLADIFHSSDPNDRYAPWAGIASRIREEDTSWDRIAILNPFRDFEAEYDETKDDGTLNTEPRPVEVLRIISQVGYPKKALGFHFPVTSGLSGMAYLLRQPIIRNDLETMADGHLQYDDFPTMSEMAFPIVNGQACGVITISSRQKDAFQPYAQDRLSYASQMITKITSLFDNVGRDVMTGLYGNNRFESEFARLWDIALENRNLGLLLIDANGQKKINDTKGHSAGNTNLKAIANGIRTCLRIGDQAFRIGGDEYAVLLPHTDTDGVSYFTQQRLIPAINKNVIRDCRQARITHAPEPVSIGWASLDEFARTEEDWQLKRDEFYDMADNWLYTHKDRFKSDYPEWTYVPATQHSL